MDQNTKPPNPANMNGTYQTPQNFFSPSVDQQSAYGSNFELHAPKKPRVAQQCLQFKRGHCTYGNNCHFSHDMRDAEKFLPPSMVNVGRNSNKEHRVVTEKGFCWKFCNGERCVDGYRCRYRHEVPLKLGKSSSTGSRSVGHFGVGQLQCRTPEGVDVLGKSVYQRPMFRKLRLCNHWEARSSCMYGANCIFAHGHAELGKVWPHTETTKMMMSSAATHPSFCRTKSGVAFEQQRPREMRPFKWKSFEKLNGIYADWIDDQPTFIKFEKESEEMVQSKPVVDSLLGKVESSN